MSSSPPALPESRQDLIHLVKQQAAEIEQPAGKVCWFEEQFYLARHKQYRTSSERSVKEQGDLFNEAEAVAEAS